MTLLRVIAPVLTPIVFGAIVGAAAFAVPAPVRAAETSVPDSFLLGRDANG